ncbi:MAG TPA: O-antigen ligase family protein [Chitinophagaceae bacterium]|jgi:O-antigen ligase|nr:O-antigen ligase family protein [Chitinophagaceae bacterium]HMU59580.1 O-antigen ligase family protein [Chitinophagaceae bacterium]
MKILLKSRVEIFFVYIYCTAIFLFAPYLFYRDIIGGIYSTSTYFIWLIGILSWIYYTSANGINYKIFGWLFFLLAFVLVWGQHNLIEGFHFFLNIFSLSGFFLFFQRRWNIKKGESVLVVLCISFLIQIMIACNQAVRNNYSALKVKGLFHNSGFFANYLAITLPLLFSYLLAKLPSRSIKNFFLSLLFLVSVLLLLISLARAAIIGFVVGSVIILFLEKKLKFNSKKRMLIVVSVIVSLSVLLLNIKPHSVSGRLTIYRVSLNLIEDNLLMGVGLNKFSSVYNNYQADYFRTVETPIDSQILATNTYEAFNSILQVLSEFGIIGFFVLLITIYMAVNLFRTKENVGYLEWHRKGSIGCLIAALCTSFFSNPFHFFPILLVLSYHLAVLFSGRQEEIFMPFKLKITTITTLIFLLIIVLYYSINQYQAEKNWDKASQLSLYGDYSKAKKYYEKAYIHLKFNGNFLFNYGAEASLAGDYTLSIFLLERSKHYASNSYIFSYLGDSYLATNQFSIAEKNYLHAAYMVPSHIIPKYKLVKLYRVWEKPEKKKYWKERALSYPTKVKTSLTEEILQELRREKDN